jgi:LemA protein
MDVGLAAGLAALVAVGVLVAIAYNRLISLRNRATNAWKQIDVQLKRRHDLIPNLVEVVKDAMAYEQETLRQVIRARGDALDAKGRAQVAAAEQRLSDAIGRLFAVAEAYPDLKANAQAAALMEELSATENRISFARQHYNDTVMALNNAVQSFPTNLVAGSFGFEAGSHFEVAPAETAPVKVDLR